MHRKQFLQTSLLATGAYFLPNVVLAFDKPKQAKDLIPERMLVAKPDFADYKYNTDGEVFIHTQLSFYDQDRQLIVLPDKHYITHQADGYGCPTLYFDGKDYYVFVTTLFKSYLMNGLVYKYNSRNGFEKQTIYLHENMGWYAFWGQCIDGKPALYHYNYGNMSMMRSQPLMAENWETERIYICQPDQAEQLYKTQLKDVNYHTQAHQFGFTYPKITDGYYTFLKFLDQMNELKRNEEKNLEAEREAKSPTVWTSIRVPNSIREIRNRQSLASETGGCGCADKLDYTQPNDKHIRLLKITNTKAEPIIFETEKYYPTSIGYYDQNNRYYQLPEKYYCLADNRASNYPKLVFDGEKYEISLQVLNITNVQYTIEIFTYTHSDTLGFIENMVPNTPEPLFAATSTDFDAMLIDNNPDNTQSPTDKNCTQYEPPIFYPFLAEEYPNVLQPIYCEGDDLTYANPKPTVLYREIPGTKIEIQNMPAYQTQDTMGECRAFSLRTILQKYLCDTFPKEIPDCKNPPPEYNISSFGLMEYTHAEKGMEKAFNPFEGSVNSIFNVLEKIIANDGLVLLESCNPFNKFVDNFTTNGQPTSSDLEKYTKFVEKIKKLYADRKPNNTEAGISEYPECLSEINQSTGLNTNMDKLKAALKKETFGQFMYTLFIGSNDREKCELQDLLTYFEIKPYPTDSINASTEDIKNKIIEGLKRKPRGPVFTPAVCLKWMKKNECDPDSGHSMVIAGYKRVCEIEDPSICKDLFKIHNSWGESWQRRNNDGWIDADIYSSNFLKSGSNKNRIASSSVLWID